MTKPELRKKAIAILAKAEREFDPNVTKKQLMTQPNIVGSWGAHNWKNISDKALLFQVNGRLHKGVVGIFLGFDDLYNVFLLDRDLNFFPSFTLYGVYAEDLVMAIDRIVETPE
mgnify:FL=1|jgi:hypothetical protein|tara:strand:- start:3049 stop:3390 length:342 start_codon:yes stop_codon:yes gene_type:complete